MEKIVRPGRNSFNVGSGQIFYVALETSCWGIYPDLYIYGPWIWNLNELRVCLDRLCPRMDSWSLGPAKGEAQLGMERSIMES